MRSDLRDAGIYVQVDGERRSDLLQDAVEMQGYFTESISQPDIEPQKIELCLVGWEKGQVDAVCLGLTRGMGVSSGRTLRFDDFVFVRRIAIEDVLPAQGFTSLQGQWKRQDAIRVGASDLTEALRKIIALNPGKRDEIENLVDIILGRYAKIAGRKAINFCQQRDALGTAIEIFHSERARRQIYGKWVTDGVEQADCFLETIYEEYCREDIIIDSDWDRFPGWDLVGPVKKHSKKLVANGRSLYITMANRTLIEEALGVDLVYYDVSTDRFVLVQYKNMKKTKGGSYECRPEAEPTYKKEIARMRKVDRTFRAVRPEKDLDNFRAFRSPFFFKFCPPRQLEARDTGLSTGFYVDLDVWELFLEHGQRGPRKGLVVTESAVGKVLSNEIFANFFNRGMIGSHTNCSHLLQDIIARSLAGDQSVVLAFAEN